MGTLFRSREMTLCQLFLQSDSAYACIRELGELGMVHFSDLNPDVSAFQRKFVNEVRRCDEMERKLRFLSNELERVGLQPTPVGFVDAPDPQDMIDLESRFEELENEVKEINTNTETLKRNMLDLVELRHIINKAQGFFEAAESFTYQGTGATAEEAKGSGLLDEEAPAVAASDQTRLTFVAGVIRRERLQRFEQVLWRACRGNVFVQQAEIEEPLEDPATGDPVYKNVFVLFFQGDQLRMRVKKICEGFRATLYECPPTSAKRREMAMAVSGRIDDLASVLVQTQDHSVTQLEAIAGQIETWKQKVVKIKAIFHTMNKFNLDVTARCLIAECWCPVEDLEAIQLALMRGTERSGSSVPSILHRITAHESPPTYNKTNKFTKGFQAIVDAYGVATYQEVNPAPYAMITFPFLFAVMFGDAGHGLIMALFAFFMILREKQLSKSKAGGDMFQIIFKGRYIIFLMGLFSIYTGLIYNDMFSKSVNIFGSSWNVSYQGLDVHGHPQTFVEQVESGGKTSTLLPTSAFEPHNPYPFGIDPIWQVSTNKLRFINSYKMKLALILGVSQMTFGVVLSLFNHIHFKRYINIVSDFIPQLLFLMSLFGYLVVLILTKWLRPWPEPAGAPSILITMINMFLNFGSSPSDFDVSKPETNPLFGNSAEPQLAIQSILVVLAVVCVPWMLTVKPLYVYIRNKRRKKRGYTMTPSRDTGDGSDDEAALVPGDEGEKKKTGDSGGGGGGGHGDHDNDGIGEVIVLQSIHTIEFCLGCLSHTASYLRLWALSLAHAELSEVLWQQIMHFGYTLSLTLSEDFAWLIVVLQIIVVFCGFAAWAVGTIGVLLIMEGLSAFLHTLRLHWIEFQTKFYVGEGYKFRPFSFADILAGEGDD